MANNKAVNDLFTTFMYENSDNLMVFTLGCRYIL